MGPFESGVFYKLLLLLMILFGGVGGGGELAEDGFINISFRLISEEVTLKGQMKFHRSPWHQ